MNRQRRAAFEIAQVARASIRGFGAFRVQRDAIARRCSDAQVYAGLGLALIASALIRVSAARPGILAVDL
jgi:hypothetical protein